MITATNKQHTKHITLAKLSQGYFGRNELAILGTTCSHVKSVVQDITAALPQYNIGFADEDHVNTEINLPISPAIVFNKKAASAQVAYSTSLNTMQQRMVFNNADLVLVNGNHFTAVKQIVVIDEAKPLHKKLDRLTNVQLVLFKEGITALPSYLVEHMPGIKEVPVLHIADKDAIAGFIKNFIQNAIPPINGLVLAGGESRRMGSDKGSLSYHEGLTQRQRVYGLLQDYCKEVYVSCNSMQKEIIGAEGLPTITDSFTGLGPLSGILSAFRQNPDRAWLTVACDLPYLSVETIQRLVQQRDISKAATAFGNTEDHGWPEPLLTIWEPRAYPLLLQWLSQGYSCPRKALINADIALLDIRDKQQLQNVNEYSDYLTALHNLQAT